jgi:hypothetical protein
MHLSGTLAPTNINSLPTKQTGVYRPCARSEHYQAHSHGRRQDVNNHVSGSKDYSYVDNRLQSSRNWGPQARK